MENVNITSLKHLKEFLNQFDDDRKIEFQCSVDDEAWYSASAYIGQYGNDLNGKPKLVIQVCPPKK